MIGDGAGAGRGTSVQFAYSNSKGSLHKRKIQFMKRREKYSYMGRVYKRVKESS